MKAPFWPTSGAIAALSALILTWQVHARTGDETFICQDVGSCSLGSGGSWLLTGVTLTGPFIAALGVAWSRRHHNNARLGPFAYRAVPDGEQIFEILAVLGAGLFTYWFVRNGPSIEPAEPLDIGRVNGWALDIRNLRLEDGAAEVTSVPSRLAWFIIGTALGAPFAMSFGTMAGREFYGFRRRRAQRNADDSVELEDDADVVDLTDDNADEFDLGLD